MAVLPRTGWNFLTTPRCNNCLLKSEADSRFRERVPSCSIRTFPQHLELTETIRKPGCNSAVGAIEIHFATICLFPKPANSRSSLQAHSTVGSILLTSKLVWSNKSGSVFVLIYRFSVIPSEHTLATKLWRCWKTIDTSFACLVKNYCFAQRFGKSKRSRATHNDSCYNPWTSLLAYNGIAMQNILILLLIKLSSGRLRAKNVGAWRTRFQYFFKISVGSNQLPGLCSWASCYWTTSFLVNKSVTTEDHFGKYFTNSLTIKYHFELLIANATVVFASSTRHKTILCLLKACGMFWKDLLGTLLGYLFCLFAFQNAHRTIRQHACCLLFRRPFQANVPFFGIIKILSLSEEKR